MIPTDHRDAVISNGMHFMRAITEAYGAEEGMRLWETIANTLDPDVKGQIFFAMLTGTYNDIIVLKRAQAAGITNRVAAIKEIRNWTGLGLKEAKDVLDLVESGLSVKITVRPAEHHSAIRALRAVGFEI
jgi:hypothetical protein